MMTNEMIQIKSLIQEELNNKLNREFILPEYVKQRGIGDYYEGMVINVLENMVNDLILEKHEARGPQSLEDYTFMIPNHKIYIDVKTVDVTPNPPKQKKKKKEELEKEEKKVTTKSSRPNVTAIKKIKKELFDVDDTEALFVAVKYVINEIDKQRILSVQDIILFYMWELDLDTLSFGNLGDGQLQITNARKEIKFVNCTKKEWYWKFRFLVISVFIPFLEQKLREQKKFWGTLEELGELEALEELDEFFNIVE